MRKRSPPSRQRGITLLVSLVLLVLITLVLAALAAVMCSGTLRLKGIVLDQADGLTDAEGRGHVLAAALHLGDHGVEVEHQDLPVDG